MSDRPGSEMDDLLGAFALDAVDPVERELVERHLAADPVARAEVDGMRETAAVLASLQADDESTPPGLWDRIAGAIGEGDAAAAPAPAAAAAVVPIDRARRSAAVPLRVFLPVVAAAAIVIALLTVSVVTRTNGGNGTLDAAYRHAVSQGARTVSLQAGTGTGPVAAEIALSTDGGGYLRNEHLAPLPEGKTYQLWALVGVRTANGADLAISAGVLGRDPGTAAFHVAGRPHAFALTVEDAPGVIASRQHPVAIGQVPA